jgi:hypothetical protein
VGSLRRRLCLGSSSCYQGSSPPVWKPLPWRSRGSWPLLTHLLPASLAPMRRQRPSLRVLVYRLPSTCKCSEAGSGPLWQPPTLARLGCWRLARSVLSSRLGAGKWSRWTELSRTRVLLLLLWCSLPREAALPSCPRWLLLLHQPRRSRGLVGAPVETAIGGPRWASSFRRKSANKLVINLHDII